MQQEVIEFPEMMKHDELRIFIRQWERERLVILWAFTDGRVYYEETTY